MWPGPMRLIKLSIKGCGAAFHAVTHYRIDQPHSNSYAAWQRMGSPIAPDKAAYDALRAAAQLSTLDAAETTVTRVGGSVQLVIRASPTRRVAARAFGSQRRARAQNASYSHWHSHV